jgi:phosphoribosylaminoimidazole-succinocarboxamide synthase
MPQEILRAQLPHCLERTELLGLGELYRGKVRDTYARGDRLVLVATDRLSAFDHVLTTIPFKGEILSRLAAFWFERTAAIAPNHLLDVPDPNVHVARRCEPIAVEVVVRGYLTGSLWRDYQKSPVTAYGLKLPDGLRKDQRFEAPLLTPSTKEAQGKHDEPISEEALVARGLCTKAEWDELRARALALFAEGQAWAKTRGLILVDTKYEFGRHQGKLYLIDEIHTPDSSRYWVADAYPEHYARGEDQQMLDKENIRQWLIQERGFSGHGPPPQIPDEVRLGLAQKYLAAFEQLTGQPLALTPGEPSARIRANLAAKGYLSP